jgi:hypothetical protein
MMARRQRSTYLKADSDNDANDDANNPPSGLKLKDVVVGDGRFLFGKGSSIEIGKDAILTKAILESGETADEKVGALVLGMNDAGLQQLVRDFMLRNQAVLEAASPGMHSYTQLSSQESATTPLKIRILCFHPHRIMLLLQLMDRQLVTSNLHHTDCQQGMKKNLQQEI